MNSYTEAQIEQKPFDWWDFIRRAKVDEITDSEYHRARDLACKWVTCACGVQCKDIPRDRVGAPYDHYLFDRGLEFSDACLVGNFNLMEEILEKIEYRSQEILAIKHQPRKIK